MMKIIRKLSLRYQLMLWNTFLILFALITTGWAINSLVKDTVEKNMVKDLTASSVSIRKMIDTTVNAGIHNYLRGIGEKNVDILDQLNKEAAAGKMDLSEAKQIGEKILLNQPIGKTGYIYALTSDGILAVHPDEGMKNKEISEYEFAQKQIREKKGYVEYTWKNPGEDKEREKVLYMAYFEPWDWIVSVSSYREEFIFLFDIREIQPDILSFQFGRSGSSFILDNEGNFLVHRQLKGNFSLLKDSESWAVLFDEMKRDGTGTIKMNWMEKSGEAPRERLFFFHHIPSLDWFVVSSVYSDEIRQQLNPIHRIILVAILMILLVLLPLSLYLGRSITRPLVNLAREMEQAGSGVYDIRAEETAGGEIGRMAAHFNAYMARLKRIHHELNQEIEERIKAVGQLKIFKKVFENAMEGISITDADGYILDVNQAFTDITGYSREEAAGQNPRILKSNRHDDAFYQEMWDRLKTRGSWAGEIWNRRKNGEAYPEILSINSIKQEDGKTSHYVAVFHDISEMKLQQEKIQHQAYHDELTGLPNRYLVRDRLSMALKTARRQNTMVAVLFMDMDNFKYFNDSLGHASGDALLQGLGNRLRQVIREQDTIARLGGDEFLVIAGDIKFQEEVLELADRLFESIKAPFVIDGHELLISLSVGITLYPEDGSDADLLIKNADMAMYQSKISGKNRYHMFTPELNRIALYKMDMVKEFRTALTQKEFMVYYQPKVDPATNRVLGLEALARRQKQDGALVSPEAFIPMAEETGMILQLSRYVLEEACKGLKILKDRFAFPLTLSINISPLEFKQPDFAGNILKGLNSHLLPASSIEIEITETTMMTDLKSTVEKLNILKKKGVSIAIDDFGTGYSSLYYLKKLPITTLKIGKSFIDDMTTDQNDANIVETIILMAKNLGIAVVAEGVETKEQFELLAKYKCDLIQGYYYANPMPLEDLILYLEEMS